MAATRELLALRLRLRWRVLLVAGVVIGIGFGVSLTSFAAARTTASAYARILAAADAADATISHDLSAADADALFGQIPEIRTMRHAVGFVGFLEGIDPELTRVFLASADGTFPSENPKVTSGRLPDQTAADEIFVNRFLAHRAGISVGERLPLTVFTNDFAGMSSTEVTVTGIGTLPREVVIDETAVLGIVILTEAFAAGHTDNVVYAQSALDLAPGPTSERDVSAQVATFGYEVQERRSESVASTSQALRPLHVVVVALGALVLLATLVVAAQLLQRERERWRRDDAILIALGFTRWQVASAHVATALLLTPLIVVIALATMWLASPIAPLGPLHDVDPAQGFALDLTMAAFGVLAIVLVILGLAMSYAWPGAGTASTPRRRTRRVAPLPIRRPAALAGLSLGLVGAAGRSRIVRSIGTIATAVALTAFVATAVASARDLTHTPARYGLGGDVLALTPYGNQSLPVLDEMFAGDPAVRAAAAYKSLTVLVEGEVVAGMAALPVKDELWPTILRGLPPRGADEVALGAETMESIGADLGDTVGVQVVNFNGSPAADPVALRISGVATFPPVVQIGFDHARLGTGLIVGDAAYARLQGDVTDDPEWTILDLTDGVDADEFIAAHPEGIPEPSQIATSWFTDARPAEILQLEEVMSLLVGAVIVAFLVVVAVLVHALWSQARSRRRELATLEAIGFTRRQLGEVVAWQSVPVALIAVLIGMPIGILLGRWAFTAFARAFDVVDRPTTPLLGVVAFAVAVLAATGIGFLVARREARKLRPSTVLRQQ